jgi:hypothetical protein
MRYQIPFDPEFYRQQSEIAWQKTNKPANKKRKLALILSVFSLVVSSVITMFTYWGMMLIIFSMVWVITAFAQNSWFKFMKLEYDKSVDKVIKGVDERGSHVITWEFHGDYLLHITDLSETRNKWPVFRSFEVSDGVLRLHLRGAEENDAVVLSEKHIGYAEFERVVAFVKEKVPAGTP